MALVQKFAPDPAAQPSELLNRHTGPHLPENPFLEFQSENTNGTAPPTEPARPMRREHVTLAIGLMLGATFVFTCTSALSKWLIETYPIGEVLFSRVFVPLIGLAMHHPAADRACGVRTGAWGHPLRGVSQSTSQTFLLIAFCMMPLASAVAINFSAPIFATLASIIFLKEVVGVGALAGARRRLSRCAGRDQSGHRDLTDRRAVRARPMP